MIEHSLEQIYNKSKIELSIDGEFIYARMFEKHIYNKQKENIRSLYSEYVVISEDIYYIGYLLYKDNPNINENFNVNEYFYFIEGNLIYRLFLQSLDININTYNPYIMGVMKFILVGEPQEQYIQAYKYVS